MSVLSAEISWEVFSDWNHPVTVAVFGPVAIGGTAWTFEKIRRLKNFIVLQIRGYGK